MKFTLVNDVHLFGPLAIMTYDEFVIKIVNSLYPVAYNGDNFDFANAEKKDLPKMKIHFNEMDDFFHKNKWAFNTGNHELGLYALESFLNFEKTIFSTHGDIPMWGEAKAFKFRLQTPGAGWFKRNVISRLVDELRRLVTVRPNDNLKAYIEAKKKQYPQITHMYFGHSHPDKNIEFVHAGVKCLIAKRGIQVYDFI